MAKAKKSKGRVRRPRSNGSNGAAKAAPRKQQTMEVGHAAGLVRVTFERETKLLDMTPTQAFNLAQALIDGARSAHAKAQAKIDAIAKRSPALGRTGADGLPVVPRVPRREPRKPD